MTFQGRKRKRENKRPIYHRVFESMTWNLLQQMGERKRKGMTRDRIESTNFFLQRKTIVSLVKDELPRLDLSFVFENPGRRLCVIPVRLFISLGQFERRALINLTKIALPVFSKTTRTIGDVQKRETEGEIRRKRRKQEKNGNNTSKSWHKMYYVLRPRKHCKSLEIWFLEILTTYQAVLFLFKLRSAHICFANASNWPWGITSSRRLEPVRVHAEKTSFKSLLSIKLWSLLINGRAGGMS